MKIAFLFLNFRGENSYVFWYISVADTPTGGGFTVALAGALMSLGLKEDNTVAWGIHESFYAKLVSDARREQTLKV